MCPHTLPLTLSFILYTHILIVFHTDTATHIYTNIPTHIRIYTHSCAHTHTHTHTHTHPRTEGACSYKYVAVSWHGLLVTFGMCINISFTQS